jgi:hypothetical protein
LFFASRSSTRETSMLKDYFRAKIVSTFLKGGREAAAPCLIRAEVAALSCRCGAVRPQYRLPLQGKRCRAFPLRHRVSSARPSDLRDPNIGAAIPPPFQGLSELLFDYPEPALALRFGLYSAAPPGADLA